MATQEEVIDAFFSFENSPWRASNFEMRVLDDDYTAYLVGDGRVVFAKREPVRQIHYWLRADYPAGTPRSLSRRGLLDQHNKVHTAFHEHRDDFPDFHASEDSEEPPEVDEIDNL